MINLSTKYLGLKLKSPLVASSSPLCKDLANLRKLEDAGAAAVVLESLFEEQIMIESNELDRNLWQSADVSAEAQGYYPDFGNYNLGPEKYLEHISQAKKALEIPVIASLNGVSKGGWIDYAKQMAQAGADALELNIYFVPTDITQSANDIENMYLDLGVGGDGQREDSGCGEDRALLQFGRQHGAEAGESGREWAGDVQPLLSARLRPGSARSGSEPGSEPLERAETAPALGRDPVRQDQGRHGDHRRRPHGGRCAEVDGGRRQSCHDDLGSA